jgi:hypothetical protein
MRIVKRLLLYVWLLIGSLAFLALGWAALGLLFLWVIGVVSLLRHDIHRDAWEFMQFSVLIWFLVIGWGFMTRSWWRYVVQVLQGK